MTEKLLPEVISSLHKKDFATPVIAVTGGKGGVGKTTVAVNLAASLVDMGYRVALVDADVDAPDAAIFLSLPLENPVDVSITMPLIDGSRCTSCGECVKACRRNAFFLSTRKVPVLMGECNGCEACLIACPENAIERGKRSVGRTYRTERDAMTLYTGELIPCAKESSIVVKALKKKVFGEAGRYDVVIVDTSPGTHCNVIHALEAADIVFAVTEPTPFGAHDLKLILDLLDYLKLKGSVILNRSDLPGVQGEIDSIAKQYAGEVSLSIPVDEFLVKCCAEGSIVVRRYPTALGSLILVDWARNVAERYMS